jgi:hypothetical protein
MAQKVARSIVALIQLATIATGVRRTIAEICAALTLPADARSAGSMSSAKESGRGTLLAQGDASAEIPLGRRLIIGRIVPEARPG